MKNICDKINEVIGRKVLYPVSNGIEYLFDHVSIRTVTFYSNISDRRVEESMLNELRKDKILSEDEVKKYEQYLHPLTWFLKYE